MTKKIRLPPANEKWRRNALKDMELDTKLTKEDVAALFKEIFATKVQINAELRGEDPKQAKRDSKGRYHFKDPV